MNLNLPTFKNVEYEFAGSGIGDDSGSGIEFIKVKFEGHSTAVGRAQRKQATAIKFITAMEFMAAVRIRRTKFDELVKLGSIKAIKKSRKIYVPVEEVDRYFRDASVR